MITLSTFVSGCLALLFLFNASPAAAQSTFGNLPTKTKPGEKIVVRDANGNETLGTITSVSASELVITEAKTGASGVRKSRTFRPDEVVRVQKYGPVWDGALTGAIVGLVPAVFIAMNCHSCKGAGSGIATSIAFGAGIGLDIDAAIPPRTLYRRDAAQSTIALAPLIGRDRRGFAVSFRF